MKTIDEAHFPTASGALIRMYNGRRSLAEARLSRGLPAFEGSNVVPFAV